MQVLVVAVLVFDDPGQLPKPPCVAALRAHAWLPAAACAPARPSLLLRAVLGERLLCEPAMQLACTRAPLPWPCDAATQPCAVPPPENVILCVRSQVVTRAREGDTITLSAAFAAFSCFFLIFRRRAASLRSARLASASMRARFIAASRSRASARTQAASLVSMQSAVVTHAAVC